MSVAYHANGRRWRDVRPAIIQHQVRNDEEDGKKAKKHTDSTIRPELSKYNQVLYHEPDLLKTMHKEYEEVNRKRVENGGRKLRADANVLIVGTIQLSDDTLKALGWQFVEHEVVNEKGKKEIVEDKLPVDQQPTKARVAVTEVYKRITQSIMAQPDRYGRVRSATIHYDETSPHVDLIADPLDVTQPDRTARTVLNGPKGTPKGKNMREMQDHLCDRALFTRQDIDRYDLRRGESRSERVDAAKKTRQAEKRVKAREEAVKASEEALTAREAKLSEKEKELNEKEKSLNTRETKLGEREEAARKEDVRLGAVQAGLKRKARNVANREKAVAGRESAVTEREKQVSDLTKLIERGETLAGELQQAYDDGIKLANDLRQGIKPKDKDVTPMGQARRITSKIDEGNRIAREMLDMTNNLDDLTPDQQGQSL